VVGSFDRQAESGGAKDETLRVFDELLLTELISRYSVHGGEEVGDNVNAGVQLAMPPVLAEEYKPGIRDHRKFLSWVDNSETVDNNADEKEG